MLISTPLIDTDHFSVIGFSGVSVGRNGDRTNPVRRPADSSVLLGTAFRSSALEPPCVDIAGGAEKRMRPASPVPLLGSGEPLVHFLHPRFQDLRINQATLD